MRKGLLVGLGLFVVAAAVNVVIVGIVALVRVAFG
jgi:hypothetical protein